jgi:hypothetical protein
MECETPARRQCDAEFHDVTVVGIEDPFELDGHKAASEGRSYEGANPHARGTAGWSAWRRGFARERLAIAQASARARPFRPLRELIAEHEDGAGEHEG